MPIAEDSMPVIATALVAIAFGLRALPRLIWPNMQGTDAFYHRAYIRLIAETQERLPLRNPRIIGPGEHSYPSLFHYLLSKSPAWLVAGVDRFGGLICDGVAALAIVMLLDLESRSLAVGAAALYLLAPGLTLVHIGPRAFTLTPRCWAHLLYFLACLALLAGSEGGPAYPLAGAVLLGLMLLSSKFAIQSVVFAFPLLAIILSDATPVLMLLGGFAFALALWGKDFIRQCRGQLLHLRWYYRHNQQMLAHRKNWAKMIPLLRQGDLTGLARALLWHNPLTSGMARHFPLFLALAFYGALETPSYWQQGLFAISAVALLPWLLTSFGSMRILGEAERYLEFAFPASWLLLWSAAPASYAAPLLSGLALLFILIYGANLMLLRWARKYLCADDEADVAAILRAREQTGGPGDVMLCLSDPESYYFLGECNIVLHKYNGDLSAAPEMEEFLKTFFCHYPYVDPARLRANAEQAGVTLILLNKDAATNLAEKADLAYHLDDLTVLHENNTYRLYQFADAGDRC